MYKNKILFLFIVAFAFFTFTSVRLVLASAINPSTPAQCTALSSTATCIIVSSPSPGCPDGRTYFDYCQSNTGTTPPEYKNCCGPASVIPPVPPLSTPTGGLKYTLLEKIPGFASTDGSDLPKYILALYNLALAIVVLSAVFMVSIGGFMYLTSAGNTSAMGTAKGVIFDALIGLVIALTAWLLLSVINPDLTNVSINGLSATSSVVTPSGSVGSGGIPTPSPSCADPTAMKTSLASGGTACEGACRKPKCSFSLAIDAAIQAASNSAGVDIKIIKAIICQESNGNPNAHAFDGGCGLMQITKSPDWVSACPASILDPATNIAAGIKLYQDKLSAVAVAGKSYGAGITQSQMAFASYNCCAGPDKPNDQSNSCKTEDGWPVLPKWACPLDPGSRKFNMCAVKNYACDVETCASQY